MKYLPLALVAILSAACSDMQVSPVAPSATSPAPSPAGPTTRPPQAIYTIALTENGGVAYLNQPWQGTLIVGSSDAAVLPASVGLTCGPQAEQVFGGFVGAIVASCTFQQTGDYMVTASVVAPTGVTTSTTIALHAIPVPEQPKPTPPSSPRPPTVNPSLTCTAAPHGQPTSCNVTVSFDGKPVTSTLDKVVWEYGNGDQATLNGPLSQYAYSQAGTYQVIAHAYYQDHVGTTSTTVVIP